MKKILFVTYFDSSIKTSIPVQQVFRQQGYETEFFLWHPYDEKIFQQAKELGLEEDPVFGNLERLLELASKADIVHLVLPGHYQRLFVENLHQKVAWNDPRRPFVVVGLVGLLAGMEFDCYYSRQAADLLYVGSQSDKLKLAEVAKKFGHDEDRIVATGLPIYDFKEKMSNSVDKRKLRFLFAGQPTMPNHETQREYIGHRLIRLAEAHPDGEVIVKPRHRPDERTFHRVLFHYESILHSFRKKKALPANLRIDYTPIRQLMEQTDILITVSSTAALEALVLGKTVAIISDLGLTEANANHFFLGSGLICSFEELEQGHVPKVDPEWLKMHVNSDGRCSENILAAVEGALAHKRKQEEIPFFLAHGRGFFEFQNKQSQFVSPLTGKKKTIKSILLRSASFVLRKFYGTRFGRKLINKSLGLARQLYAQSTK